MHADHSVSRLTGPGHPVTSVGPWTWHTAWTRKKLTLCLTRTHQRRCLSGARVRVKVREVRGRTGQSEGQQISRILRLQRSTFEQYYEREPHCDKYFHCHHDCHYYYQCHYSSYYRRHCAFVTQPNRRQGNSKNATAVRGGRAVSADSPGPQSWPALTQTV